MNETAGIYGMHIALIVLAFCLVQLVRYITGGAPSRRSGWPQSRPKDPPAPTEPPPADRPS